MTRKVKVKVEIGRNWGVFDRLLSWEPTGVVRKTQHLYGRGISSIMTSMIGMWISSYTLNNTYCLWLIAWLRDDQFLCRVCELSSNCIMQKWGIWALRRECDMSCVGYYCHQNSVLIVWISAIVITLVWVWRTHRGVDSRDRALTRHNFSSNDKMKSLCSLVVACLAKPFP
jgi:hypothetical protein